ncbi:MAG TPA: disulfide bond formation protein B [Alphaproteobacteria bacterium]|nr:disulfide bond formation protein B [Alphaproteobacteria bacterium]
MPIAPGVPLQPRGDIAARTAFLGLLAASVLILGGAFAFQFIGGLHPCALCLWQRYPYAVIIGLAGIGAGLARAGVQRHHLAILMGLCALAFMIDAGIAGFHVGVEQKWWEGLSTCSGTVSGAASLDDLRDRLLAAPVIRCDEIAWSMFGISMAGYNFLMALALGLLSLRLTASFAKTPTP